MKLLDKYKLGKVLGQGAFGVVYSCSLKNGKDGRVFAVKMIDKVESPVPDIQREVDMLRRLAHPTVVTLHDVFFESVFVYMVLDLLSGGDMIEGMQLHWQSKGQIPILAVQTILKQMVESIAWLHSNNCAHRDVKGDNYLMDRKDLAAEGLRILLSDFGTVTEMPADGGLLGQPCGTKVYWSPEFYKQVYGMKVDVWACGVILFGLLTGRFPFNCQEEVETKAVKLPKQRTTPEGEALVKGLLEKQAAARFDAKVALKHPWISTIPTVAAEAATLESMDFQPELQETRANGGIAERRRELVERLERANAAKDGNYYTDVRTGPFQVKNDYEERTATFEWWPKEKVESTPSLQVQGMRGETEEDIRLSIERNTPGINRMLQAHLDVSRFGQGLAESLPALVQECQAGAAQLMLDAREHKKVVRVVDLVLLKIVLVDKRTNLVKYLVQMSEEYKDGRHLRGMQQIPGTKKLPYENAMQTAQRVLQDRLSMTPEEGYIIQLEPIVKDSVEDEEQSVHFPGLTTVYRKEIIEGRFISGPSAPWTRASRHGVFSTMDQGTTYGWAWLPAAACLAKRVRLDYGKEPQAISPLVQAPVGFSPETLAEYLTSCGVDVNKFGKAGTKSLREFSEELTKGEATLTRVGNDNTVIRVVDVVVVKLVNADARILVEVSEELRGVTKPLHRLPAVKRRPEENQFFAACRVLRKVLRIDPNTATMDHVNVGITEEKKDSPSYPGMSSIYRKRIVTVMLQPKTVIARE